MATSWTNPVAPGSPIRAEDITELRSAINCNRAAGGLSTYSWTDDPLVAHQTPIKGVHMTQMRQAIQDLWSRKNMGTLPAWSSGVTPASGARIYASDVSDLRNRLNTYEDTGGFRGPKRGVHLRNGADLRSSDLDALQRFGPGLVVVLSSDATRPNMLNYLKSVQNSAEIFIRHYPTYAPVYQSYSLYDPTYRYIFCNYDKATQKTPQDVATEIINAANSLKAAGLTNFRWFTGNEPDLEWTYAGDRSWYIAFWQDVQHYYRDIYDQLEAQGRPCEIYPPAFQQFSCIAVANYWSDGTVTRKRVSNSGAQDFTGANEDYGVYWCIDMIDHHTNGTPVGRFLQHSYFWPGYQGEQAVYNFWPQFLKDRKSNGMPNRITEFGWFPNCFDSPCSANLDTTHTSCDGARTNISSWGDYNAYVRVQGNLDGYAVWLLSDGSGEHTQWLAVKEDGVRRPWFDSYVCFLNA